MHSLVRLILLYFFLILSPFTLQAKGLSGTKEELKVIILNGEKDSTISNQKDIREVLAKALNIRMKSDSLNLTGNGPFVSVFPSVGYSLQSGYLGLVSISTSFYGNKQRNKISNILLNFNYSQYHQFWTIANSNIFFDRIHLFGDWRFYKFPTHTYGLGSNSTFADRINIDFSYLRFYQIVYFGISDNFFAGLGYNLDYHWDIIEDPQSGEVYNAIHAYQTDGHSMSSGFTVNFQFDNRKNSINPDRGVYAGIQLRQNLTALGSDRNWKSLIIDFRHYIKLPSDTRNVLAFWSYNNLTLKGQPPYFDMPCNGWDDYNTTGRGYVPGRYRGNNFVYAESEYRIVLTKNGLLGCVAFCNAQTEYQRFSENSKRILPGGGLGIRIKINKYSNANLAIDYGVGVEGSRGFFFNLGEFF